MEEKKKGATSWLEDREEKVGSTECQRRRVDRRKVSFNLSWECYDIRALSTKATQTVTLRRRIDKIFEEFSSGENVNEHLESFVSMPGRTYKHAVAFR